MGKKSWIVFFGLVAAVLVGCATETGEDGGVEDGEPGEEEVDEVSSAAKGGCSQDQINASRESCKRTYGAKSRGIQFCNWYGPGYTRAGGYSFKCSVRK